VAEAGDQISETSAEAQSKAQTTLDEIKAKLDSMKAELKKDAEASGGSGNSAEASTP